jgi:hypothetical protein
MDSLPEDIFIHNISKYLTFRDLGNLIKTSVFFRDIYNNNDFWKKIYLMTCPNKWELTEHSNHLDYNETFRCMLIQLYRNWKNNLPIDIHECNNIFKIWNCQNSGECNDITHYDINSLQSTKILNYDYKRKVLDKSRSRLTDKDKNKIFLKQYIFPDRIEWYDIIGCPTYIF